MPIFEYLCDDCGVVLEVVEKVGLEERECDKCGGRSYRVFSVPAPPVIKGEGGSWNKHVDKHRFPFKQDMLEKNPTKVRDFMIDRGQLEGKADLWGE